MPTQAGSRTAERHGRGGGPSAERPRDASVVRTSAPLSCVTTPVRARLARPLGCVHDPRADASAASGTPALVRVPGDDPLGSARGSAPRGGRRSRAPAPRRPAGSLRHGARRGRRRRAGRSAGRRRAAGPDRGSCRGPPWRPSHRCASPASEGRVAPHAEAGRRHRELARHDLQRLAPHHPQHRAALAPRRHPPLPHRSRRRSDLRGLRPRLSSALDVIQLSTSIGSR